MGSHPATTPPSEASCQGEARKAGWLDGRKTFDAGHGALSNWVPVRVRFLSSGKMGHRCPEFWWVAARFSLFLGGGSLQNQPPKEGRRFFSPQKLKALGSQPR